MTARVFRHRLRNEIFFDPIVPNPLSWSGIGSNVNLDPTERSGIELEGTIRLMSSCLLSANLQHISARFRSGPYAGNDMVLVPRNTVSLRLNWLPGTEHTASAGIRWVDSQRHGGDFANACPSRIPAFTVLDARYAYRTGPWEFAITGSNLTDRRYYTSAFGTCPDGIYPEAGRQLKLSVRYDF